MEQFEPISAETLYVSKVFFDEKALRIWWACMAERIHMVSNHEEVATGSEKGGGCVE